MEREKKPEFVVTDRRKFNVDGEPRADAPVETPSAAATPAPPPAESAKPPQAKQPLPGKPQPKQPQPGQPQPSSAAQPQAEKSAMPRQASPLEPRQAPASSAGPDLTTGYSGDRERASFGGQKMEFVHLLDMLVQTAMMYAGAMDNGTERRVDIVGLRQMIDLIAVLEEKTKGNLNEQEATILKNTIFQLRMTYMKIVNMIECQAMQKGPGASGPAGK